ncbi:MAG TPA: hypothetical protein PKI19_12150 [Elusimicrobiales bacterium]|nr:hypothetical protein [Elusimicrobiales bacterium]
MRKSLLWVLSFLITVAFALFQRMTGPTYPVKGSGISAGGVSIASYRFPRSCTTDGQDCVVRVKSAGELQGFLLWRRYRTEDAFQKAALIYKEGQLSGALPSQPPAGKLEYRVFLKTAEGETELSKDAVVTRFKGAVPAWALIPHIVFIFLFMFFSVRIFLAVFFSGLTVRHAVPLNLLFLLLGGFVFGPVVQHYAFGQAWTGFPFGYDLTDNKTLLMLVFWLPALAAVLKDRPSRGWILLAFSVTALVYLVPHSMFGSELDYRKGEVVTGGSR